MRLWFKLIGWTLGVVGVVCAFLYAFFVDVWVVPADDPALGVSIQPTLALGDVLVVTRHGAVARGNLVRCDDPQAPGRYVVARAIGHSGDHLLLEGETPSIDGRRTPSPRACDTPIVTMPDARTGEDVPLACSIEDYGESSFSALRATAHPEPPTSVTVEPGTWYLLSDNRHFHVDSRDYGPIDPRTCRHIVFRLVGGAGLGDEGSRLTIIW